MTTQANTDPRPLFTTAYTTAGKVIAAIGPDQFSLPTPCDAYDVAGLLGHLRMAARRVAAVGRGDADAFANNDPVPAPADGDHAGWWDETGAAIAAAWTDQRLTDTITLPWAEVTGAAALCGYINEVTLHTWDLAVATGQDVAWDDEVVGAGWQALQAVLGGAGRTAQFDAMREHLPPAFRDMAPPFLEPVAATDDRPLIEQVAAWSGRHPEAWSR